jgi:hypothetical protein
MRHQRINILKAHALLDGAFHPGETDPNLILEKFADGTYAAIAEVVNVIHLSFAGAEIHEIADNLDNVLRDRKSVV